ncbi:MAG: PilX N-terminal domain-containing pilus assembly protein, partial [Desulfuromusa sp.]|nr:PilX N-terminal domain-containing pilus assembly protein [Desulfuromusa sp.]
MKQIISNERGAVLITGLMILVILSLLGISTMQTSTLEEKMTNNMSQRQLAFQATEAGLREAEGRISDGLSVDP